jgi:hypothetical protein
MASRRETQATCSVVKRNSKSAGKLDGGGRIYLLIEYPGRLTGAARRTTEEIEAIQGPQGILSMRDPTAGISLQNIVFSPKDAVFQRDVGATFDAGCPRPPEGCLTLISWTRQLLNLEASDWTWGMESLCPRRNRQARRSSLMT